MPKSATVAAAAERPEIASSLTVQVMAIEDARPNPNNSRVHSPAQVSQIEASMREFGWTIPMLIDVGADGLIVAGHGRRMAASRIYGTGGVIRLLDGRELPPGTVPFIDCTGWSEEQRRAYTIADNKLAENATWDEALLRIELADLKKSEAFDVGLVGFSAIDLERLFKPVDLTTMGAKDVYSRKIKAPIYEPKGDTPAVAELVDRKKTDELVAEIRAAGLPADVAAFLETAAERHTVFHFRRIADYYAAAPAEVQRLMEKSALVIIDFNQAIENGFVRLTKRLGDLASTAPAVADPESDPDASA